MTKGSGLTTTKERTSSVRYIQSHWIARTIFSASGVLLSVAVSSSTATAGPATVTYGYDSIGRIVANAQSTGNSSTYTYDTAGNRTSATQN